MLKQFLAKQNGFDQIVRVGESLTIRASTEGQARDIADKALSAYEQTVPWRFERNVTCAPIAHTEPPEWSFDLVQLRPNSHGGKREGAGKKPANESGPKEPLSARVASDVLKTIRQQPNQAEFIEQLVREWKQSRGEPRNT